MFAREDFRINLLLGEDLCGSILVMHKLVLQLTFYVCFRHAFS